MTVLSEWDPSVGSQSPRDPSPAREAGARWQPPHPRRAGPQPHSAKGRLGVMRFLASHTRYVSTCLSPRKFFSTSSHSVLE